MPAAGIFRKSGNLCGSLSEFFHSAAIIPGADQMRFSNHYETSVLIGEGVVDVLESISGMIGVIGGPAREIDDWFVCRADFVLKVFTGQPVSQSIMANGLQEGIGLRDAPNGGDHEPDGRTWLGLNCIWDQFYFGNQAHQSGADPVEARTAADEQNLGWYKRVSGCAVALCGIEPDQGGGRKAEDKHNQKAAAGCGGIGSSPGDETD